MAGAWSESCKDCALGNLGAGGCPFHPADLQAGSLICAQGDIQGMTYFLRSGSVGLSDFGASGSEESYSIRMPGALLCWESLLGLPAPVEVRALSSSRVCSLPRAAMQEWLGTEAWPGRAVVALLLDELQRRQRDAELRKGSSLSRVARFLLDPKGWGAQPGFRKRTVARLLGMQPETLSRCLKELAQRQLIASTRSLRVLDRAGLGALAGQLHRFEV